MAHQRYSVKFLCFHSINVPSEWGLHELYGGDEEDDDVSIQLMSPASGDDPTVGYGKSEVFFVSIQLMSPASGDYEIQNLNLRSSSVSIQLMSPASGDPIEERSGAIRYF